ncbi:MAG TPA: hypothetical protein VFI29_13740 [Hanamia sp.]|nr:hypothetical protein [Hanamia sp.]
MVGEDTDHGEKPFDTNAAGVTGNKQWKDLAKLPKEVTNAFDSSVSLNMLS